MVATLTTEGLEANVGDVTLESAVNRVAGILRDSLGNPVAGAELWLWGERFFTNPDGSYLSPPLPAAATLEPIRVMKATGFQGATIFRKFQDGETPVQGDVLAAAAGTEGGSGSGSGSGTDTPPSDVPVAKVALLSDLPNNGHVDAGKPIQVWAVFAATGEGRTQIGLDWRVQGTITTGTASLPPVLASDAEQLLGRPVSGFFLEHVVWQPPSATMKYRLSVQLQSPAHGKCFDTIKAKVGGGTTEANLPPTATIFGPTDLQVSQTATFSAIAADPDGFFLTFSWSATPMIGGFGPAAREAVNWTAPVTTGTVRLQLRVSDGLDVADATQTVTILPGDVQLPPPEITPGKIAGHLVDATTGKPIVGALIGILGTDRFMYTDTFGYFEFANLASGTYQIGATMTGYKGKTFPGIVVP